MEDYIQFSAKTKNEAITKACLELGTSSDQLDIQVISEGSSGFFGIGSKPAVIKVRRIEPVSDMQEIDELVESVKLDAIKEEKKLEKPFTPDVKKESAPKAAPAEEKKPVKKEAVQVEKASEEAPAKAAAPAKKAPAKKAAPAKATAPKAVKLFVEYQGGQVSTQDIAAKAAEASGKKAIKELNVYYQPETNMVYYTADGTEGSFSL